MRIFKRVLCYASIVVGAIFLVIFLASIVGIWIARAQVNQSVVNIFTKVDLLIEKPNAMINEMIDRRQKMQEGINNLSSEIDRLGTEIENTPVILEAVDKLMGEQLIPALEKINQSAHQFYAEVSKLETSINSLNSFALFRDQEGILNDVSTFLNEFLTSLDQLDSNFSTLKDTLAQRKTDAIQTMVTTLQQPIAKIDTALSDSQTRLEKFSVRLKTLQVKLDSAQKKITQLITIMTIILTIVLIWLTISQGMVILYSLGVLKSTSSKVSEPAEQITDKT